MRTTEGGSQHESQAAALQGTDRGSKATQARTSQVGITSEAGVESVTSGLPHVLEVAAGIIAPTTLLTALMFFFGWSHAYWFCYYFGVNSTMLHFTMQDYLMRSVDAFFIPLTAIAVALLLALWVHRFVESWLRVSPKSTVLRKGALATMTVGVFLFAVGLTNVLGVRLLNYFHIPPLSLAIGVVLLMYGSRLYRKIERQNKDLGRVSESALTGIAEWTVVFILVSLGLFWAVVDYSTDLGRSRAIITATRLRVEPSVVLYSARSLDLQAPGVRELICSNPDVAYHFRYDGLRLVLESDNQYFFLPAQWSPSNGVAFVIPRNDSMRLEFAPVASAKTNRPTACK